MEMPSSNPRYARYQERVNVRKWLRAQRRPCWICRAFGREGSIDYSLPSGHPFSFEVDDLVPVSAGGDPASRSNVDAAHRCCNQWRGARPVGVVLELARKDKGCVPDVKEPPIVSSVTGVTSCIGS
jgi:hypothetical protein